MERHQKKRFMWVNLYQQTGDAGLVCRRCGISRSPLRKWYRRFLEAGIDGLKNHSRKPCNSPNRKITSEAERLILEIRKKRKLGARRIQNELKRLHFISLSLASIHKILKRNQVKPLLRIRTKSSFKSYSWPVPGDRIQMDTKKLSAGKYPYTAKTVNAMICSKEISRQMLLLIQE